MTAHEFVQSLQTVAPCRQALAYSPAEATSYLRRFKCTQKRPLPQASTEPLLDLLNDYDVSNFELGLLRFWGPETFNDIIVVGAVDLDCLYVHISSKQVRVGSHRSPSRFRWLCADSQGQFLDALTRVAWIAGQRVVDEQLGEADDVFSLLAYQCAGLAGGLHYLPFYRSLLNCLDC